MCAAVEGCWLAGRCSFECPLWRSRLRRSTASCSAAVSSAAAARLPSRPLYLQRTERHGGTPYMPYLGLLLASRRAALSSASSLGRAESTCPSVLPAQRLCRQQQRAAAAQPLQDSATRLALPPPLCPLLVLVVEAPKMSGIQRVEDPTLPAPWQALYDPNSRLKYYWVGGALWCGMLEAPSRDRLARRQAGRAGSKGALCLDPGIPPPQQQRSLLSTLCADPLAPPGRTPRRTRRRTPAPAATQLQQPRAPTTAMAAPRRARTRCGGGWWAEGGEMSRLASKAAPPAAG